MIAPGSAKSKQPFPPEIMGTSFFSLTGDRLTDGFGMDTPPITDFAAASRTAAIASRQRIKPKKHLTSCGKVTIIHAEVTQY